MAKQEAQMRARVREELQALVLESDGFEANAFKERLEKVLALVKEMPNTTTENESATETADQSPACRVFHIYELAEIILANVSRKDILHAQNVTKITRNVVRTSKRVQKRHAVLNHENYHEPSPFKRSIDFDLTRSKCAADDMDNRYHLIDSGFHGGEGQIMPACSYLEFHRALEGKMTWETCSGYNDPWCGTEGKILYTRTVIVPDGNPDSQELWRFLAVSDLRSPRNGQEEEQRQVEVTLHTTCWYGHPFEDVKVFAEDVTMGQVCDFLHECVRSKHPADPCPDAWMSPLPEDWENRVHRKEW